MLQEGSKVSSPESTVVSPRLPGELNSPSPNGELDPPPFSRKHRPLFEGKHWRVLLYRNQSYLGRSLVYLKTRRLEDVLDLTDEERQELWDDIMPRLVEALTEAFQPDRINYSHLTNRVKQVHWHVVPRYEINPKRQFAGHTFTDRRVGKMFRTKKFPLPGKVLDQIRDHIKKHLN
jgi:diadenosine tetraphosphate (Ap4A) HIT family hydrolase